MDATKTSDYMKIKVQMPNPSQEPPTSSKALNQDSKDMAILGTLIIKKEIKYGT